MGRGKIGKFGGELRDEEEDEKLGLLMMVWRWWWRRRRNWGLWPWGGQNWKMGKRFKLCVCFDVILDC